MQLQTEGIVLRQIRATGGRRLLSVFTKKYGKISIGTNLNQKSRTKAALAVKPFTLGNYHIFKNRDYYNLDGGETIRSYYGIGEDVNKYMCASYALELTYRLLPEGMAMVDIFENLKKFLKTMEKRPIGHELLVIAYEIKLLRSLGTFPILDRCVCCGEKKKLDYFTVTDGGGLCSTCKEKQQDRLIYEDKFGIIEVISYLDKKDFSDFEKITLDREKSLEIHKVLRDYIAYHFEVMDLKSEVIFKENF